MKRLALALALLLTTAWTPPTEPYVGMRATNVTQGYDIEFDGADWRMVELAEDLTESLGDVMMVHACQFSVGTPGHWCLDAVPMPCDMWGNDSGGHPWDPTWHPAWHGPDDWYICA